MPMCLPSTLTLSSTTEGWLEPLVSTPLCSSSPQTPPYNFLASLQHLCAGPPAGGWGPAGSRGRRPHSVHREGRYSLNGKGLLQGKSHAGERGCSGVRVRPERHVEGVDLVLLLKRALRLLLRRPVFSTFNPQRLRI